MALEDEQATIRNDLRRRGLDQSVPALSGRPSRAARRKPARTAQTGHRYTFQIEKGKYDIRAGDRIRVHAGPGVTGMFGVVRSFNRALGLVEVSTAERLDRRELGDAQLEWDPAELLAELSSQLSAVGDSGAHPRQASNRFPSTVLSAFGMIPPAVGRGEVCLPASGDLNEPQRAALERVLGSSMQLVWGPPGTGKTRLATRAALELALRGRVLVATTTNGAIDQVATHLASLADPSMLERGGIVRAGFDRNPGGAVLDERIDLESMVARRIEASAGRTIDRWEQKLGAASASGAALAPSMFGTRASPVARVRGLLSRAKSQSDTKAVSTFFQEILLRRIRESKRVLESADIVLTTFASLSIRDEFKSLGFESLIIDEAGSAILPYVALAASRVSGTVLAIGDFRQLPAVVASKSPAAARWLRTDLFRQAGVLEDASASALPSPNDGLCSILDVQYRMVPEIRDVVSHFFYGGLLRDAQEVESRPVAAGSAVVLLDTSNIEPALEQPGGSRRNRPHAEAIAKFLAQAARDGFKDIAVVSPYRAQTRHLYDLVRRRLGRAAPRGLQVSTIHRFQGREKDLVIFDTVDAPPARSFFLNEQLNPDFPRLLNVALSRARNKLVIVASVSGLRRTLPPDALLNRLLARLCRQGVSRAVSL